MNRKLVWLVLLLALSPHLMGAFISWTAGSFEVSPPGTESLSLTDDRIRELKENIRNRLQVEHHFGTGVSASDNGRHREGSATAWYEATCPSGNVTGDPGTGTTAYGATDAGKLCFDTDNGYFQVWNGSAWVRANGSLSGTIDLIDTPMFSKGGADAFDIHAHDGRHRLTGTSGAWVDALDGMPFAIQQVLTDTSVDTAGCITAGTVSNTAIAAQAFGDAGLACLSITTGLDFTGRTGNSRLIVMAVANTQHTADFSTCQMAVYLDSTATQLGLIATESIQDAANARGNLVVFSYTAAVSAAAHEIAVHFSDSVDPNCVLMNAELFVVDLGNST